MHLLQNVKNACSMFCSNPNKWSYFHGGGLPLIGATIGQLLEEKANKYPDGDAVVVVFQGVRLTFPQLLEQVLQMIKYTRFVSDTIAHLNKSLRFC